MAVAVAAAQPPEAATVLVTVYVPGAEVPGVITPVAASSVRPAVLLKVPAVAPVVRTGATLPVAEVQYAALG